VVISPHLVVGKIVCWEKLAQLPLLDSVDYTPIIISMISSTILHPVVGHRRANGGRQTGQLLTTTLNQRSCSLTRMYQNPKQNRYQKTSRLVSHRHTRNKNTHINVKRSAYRYWSLGEFCNVVWFLRRGCRGRRGHCPPGFGRMCAPKGTSAQKQGTNTSTSKRSSKRSRNKAIVT